MFNKFFLVAFLAACTYVAAEECDYYAEMQWLTEHRDNEGGIQTCIDNSDKKDDVELTSTNNEMVTLATAIDNKWDAECRDPPCSADVAKGLYEESKKVNEELKKMQAILPECDSIKKIIDQIDAAEKLCG